MTIYKQVISQPNHHMKPSSTQLNITDSDETFEYFSDKEEAEKHIDSRKQNPKML